MYELLDPNDHYGWLLAEDVFARAITTPDGDRRALVTDTGRRWAAILAYGPQSPDDALLLTVNGEIVDWGDDFPSLLGILDAADEAAGEEAFLEADPGEHRENLAHP